jgi:NAD(P)-dependent dehydrogenase (short-subunit alcohol dehydrogenase family)
VSRPPLTLAARTAIVTGAGSGIGRALALHAAAEGMAVALCDVDAAGLRATGAALGAAPHLARVVDVTDGDTLAAFAQEMAEALPPPVLLFANAGILRQGPILSMPIADWERLFTINVLGTVRTLQAFVPTLDTPGQIVVTGSTGTMANHPGLGAYCATKHALWPICEALRNDMAEAERPVGVSLLMPGAVATHIFDAANPDRETPADSISPDEAARIAFAGALVDKPLILTHPHFVERAQARFEGALAALR